MSAASDFEEAVSEILFEINQAAASRADEGLRIIRNVTEDVLGQDGTGRVYGKHIASAPGDPPAPDTGSLRNNWRDQKLALPNGIGKGIRIFMRRSSKMFYAHYLDDGTSKMAARPFVKPIEEKATPQVTKLFANI